jgi:uracil-DNA glycosylase
MKVLFVGDKPSAKNLDPDIAFEGSRSGETLKTWAKSMGLNDDDYTAINRVDEFFVECCKSFVKADKAVISLGVRAHKALLKAGVFHFPLPHPSGLNRKINDKDKLNRELSRCMNYINSWNVLRREKKKAQSF